MGRNKQSNRWFLPFVLVCIMFIISTVVALLYFNYTNSKKILYNYDDLELDFYGNNFLDLNNKLPISDELGKNYDGTGSEEGIQGYMSFSIVNHNDKDTKYDIYLTKSIFENKKNISDYYIKLYLTDADDKACVGFEKNVIPSYGSLPVLVDKPGSKLLYSATIPANSLEKFKLRVWVSDKYILSNNEENFKFVLDVRSVS